MQAVRDIFEIWGAPAADAIQTIADELDEKPDTVYRWRQRRRIPELKWDGLIKSAASRGVDLTPDELFRFNRSQPAKTPRTRAKKTGKVRALRAVQ